MEKAQRLRSFKRLYLALFIYTKDKWIYRVDLNKGQQQHKAFPETILTEQEQIIINAKKKSKKLPVRIVQRARIIQMVAPNYENIQIASKLGISHPTLQLWRNRFLSFRLPGLEKDAPRPGRMPKVSHKKVMAIENATLHTTPPDATHWSTRTMAGTRWVSNATVQRI